MTVIGDNIARMRGERGWSQDTLADRAGTTQTTIEKIEKGYTRRSRFFMDIAKAFGVTVGELDPSLANVVGDVVIPRAGLVDAKDLAIYSATEEGEESLVISRDPIDFVKRPAPLMHVRDGYGVVVVGESMVPVFRPGDVALVHPQLPPRFEDVCVFQKADQDNQLSTIKEFVTQTGKAWKVKRYRPNEVVFDLAKAQWPRCHVVVGKYSRR